MNTDASSVEDMNIHHIKERLSMSCIESFEDWSNIFRIRSFTLFKNDRDLRERFDSVAVSESISSSMTNLSSTGLPVLVFDISPDFTLVKTTLSSMFHSLFLVAAHSTSSEVRPVFQIRFSLGFPMQ